MDAASSSEPMGFPVNVKQTRAGHAAASKLDRDIRTRGHRLDARRYVPSTSSSLLA